MVDSLPEPPRVDPAIVQAWRDRQLKNLPKDKLSMAEQITAANRLAELFNNPQTLTGGLTKTGAGGASVQVALDKPYKGLSTISAVAATGCDRFGRVTMLRDKNNDWYAFGGGTEKLRSDRDKERSGESGTTVENVKYLMYLQMSSESYTRAGSSQPLTVQNIAYYVCGWQNECKKIGVFQWWEPGNLGLTWKQGVSFDNTGSGDFLLTVVYLKNPGMYSTPQRSSDYWVADRVYACYNQDGLIYEYTEAGLSDLAVNGFVWTSYNPYKNPQFYVINGGKVVSNFNFDNLTSFNHPSSENDSHTIVRAYSGTADLSIAVSGQNPFSEKARWNSEEVVTPGREVETRSHAGINYKSFVETASVVDNYDLNFERSIVNRTNYIIYRTNATGEIALGCKFESIGTFPYPSGGIGLGVGIEQTPPLFYIGNTFINPNAKPHVYDENQNSATYRLDTQEYDRYYPTEYVFNAGSLFYTNQLLSAGPSPYTTVMDDGSIILVEHQRPEDRSEKALKFALPPYKKEENTLKNITSGANLNTERQVSIAKLMITNGLLGLADETEETVFSPDVIDVANAAALATIENPKHGDYRRVPSAANRVYVYSETAPRILSPPLFVSAGASPGRWETTTLEIVGASYG